MSTAKTERGNLHPRGIKTRLETSETEATGTIERIGKTTELQSELSTYAVGGSVTIFGKSLNISRTVLESGEAGVGKLTVTATKEVEETEMDPVTGQPVTTPVFTEELEWQLQNKPLSEFAGTAPMDFATLFSTPASAAYQGLARWLDARDESKYVARTAAFQTPTVEAANKEGGADPSDDDDWVELSDLSETAQKYAEKIAKGIEEFMVQVPVYRKTSTTSDIGNSSGVGSRSSPGGHAPSGYVWLKTADNYHRDTKHGRWTHSEEWTGFASLDSDLYPA